MKTAVLICLFLISLQAAWAQKMVAADTSRVMVRPFKAADVQRFREDGEFKYRAEEPVTSLWSRFWAWVWMKIAGILSTRSGRVTTWSVLIMISIAVVAYFLFTTSGLLNGGIFSRKNSSLGFVDEGSEDIHSISFDEAIQRALAERNYRQALRLVYLQALKLLTDKGHIEWQPDKTNNDYLHEIRNQALQPLFKDLTGQFEYTWYGEHNINRGDFDDFENQFKQLKNQVL